MAEDNGSPRAWRVVLDHVEALLRDGELRVGDRLPGERALSAELGVGRSSVREALRVLEVMGLIRTASGSGPQAGAIIVASPAGGMSVLMRLQVAAHGFPVADVVQARLLVEAAVAADLARAGGDLSDAHALLSAMDASDVTAEDFLALDASYHLALAAAAGNEVLTATMAGLRSAIEDYARAGAARLADWPAMTAQLRAEHHALIEAIEAGDADLARTLIHDHISGYYAAISLTH